MRIHDCALTIALAAVLTVASAPLAGAAAFGTVVSIGGQASDIALDETRGVVYVANFTANRIDVVSTSDNAIHSSMNVAPQPGALAMSSDAHYLLAAHYGNWLPTDPQRNLITLIDLTSGARQTFVMGDAPLAVAFVAGDQALIATQTSLVLFNPVTGGMQTLTTFTDLAPLALPQPSPTFPQQITQSTLAVSGDGYTVWGLGAAGTQAQVVFRYDARLNRVAAPLAAQSTPPLLPRVSVSGDGTQAMIGYAVFGANFGAGVVLAQYPNPVASTNITGSAIDSVNGIVYAQIPDTTYPAAGPPFTATNFPVLSILSAANLTVRERLKIPEDMVGRAVLTASGQTLYAISESGLMVLPVGAIKQYPRLAVAQEDVLIQTIVCNQSILSQPLTIADPGGNHTDFSISVSQAGVTVSPSSGVTPATVQISVNPTAFQNQTGTSAIPLTITSQAAINLPQHVRLLVSNPGPDQRGTIIDVPGTLSDMLADPVRNLVYLLRQDKNELLVYNGTTYALTAALPTATTPTRMNFATDGQHLLVGYDNAQVVSVFDMNALQQSATIPLPFGHYARSVAASNASTLAVVRNGTAASVTGGTSGWVGAVTGSAQVDRLDTVAFAAVSLPALGVWVNQVSADATLAAAPNGASMVLADSNGDVMLYTAAADTFVSQRQDFSALQGAIAASSYNTYVVGSNVLNASIVPAGVLDTSAGAVTGFAFVNQGGFLMAGTSASAPGAIENLPGLPSAAVKPTRMVEAPVMPAVGNVFTRTVSPLATGTNVIALTTSGFTVVAWNYDAAVALPTITSVVNAANGGQAVAPGGLISIFGQNMSPVTQATNQIPLPTALAQSCVEVNGTPIPLLYVSTQQVNAQLPNNVVGSATMAIYTAGGESDSFYFTVSPTAPSIFLSGTAGPETGLATVVRWNDQELVTPTNPIHPNDYVEIYLTGMGATMPSVAAGLPGPANPLAMVQSPPSVMLGGYPLTVTYAGLAPGEVGVYQIDAFVPFGVPLGLSVPLAIYQGGGSTSVNERVVN
jgi:uncharacterized protein (TIGR03437 family)